MKQNEKKHLDVDIAQSILKNCHLEALFNVPTALHYIQFNSLLFTQQKLSQGTIEQHSLDQYFYRERPNKFPFCSLGLLVSGRDA